MREGWQNPEFTKSLSSLGSFSDMLGLGRLPHFFSTHQFHKVQDWSEQQLDAEGRAMQAEILNRIEVMLILIRIIAHADRI